MLRQKYLLRIVLLLALIVLISACTSSLTPVPPTQSAPPPPAQTDMAPTAGALPTEAPQQAASPAAPIKKGFVLYDKEKAEFQAYAPDGTLLFTNPAPGSEYPSPYTTSITNEAIYYLIERNLAKNQTPQLMRSTPAGVEKVTVVPSENLSALAVSPDETWAAWSIMHPENGSSDLWIINLKTSEQRKIASYSHEQSQAFFLRPFDWTEDGKLLFERSLTGLGGYILFGGHNSLYTYDPTSGEIATIVPAEEQHGLCLDSYHPAQGKVIFNCGKEKNEIIIRDLKDQSEKSIPSQPNQGVSGTARYAPSGQWLAYAIAANNPDNESGQLLIVPADLSATPQAIAEARDNSYIVVQGWLDEDTLVFNRGQGPQSSTWTVKRDGSELKQIATGLWAGWMP